jgi:hypothetical protein
MAPTTLHSCILTALLLSVAARAADNVLFQDDFEKGDFKKKWTSGATCEDNSIKVVDGRVQATLNCNYIETKQEFSGDLQVSVDVEKVGTQFYSCWDFYVEITGANGMAGIVLFDYNMSDGVAVGTAPHDCGGGITRPASSPNKGTLVVRYSSPYIDFSFVNSDGKVLAMGSEFAGGSEKTKVRIWLAGHKDAPRYVDNVKVTRIGGAKK